MKSPQPKKKTVVHQKPGSPAKNKKPAGFTWWMSLLVVLPVTFISYVPCLQNGFTNWDDPTYITDNPLIRELSWPAVKRIFSEVYFSNYQPLHIFSYALEYHFFKDQPHGYHLVSVLMHLVNTGLLCWLAWLITGNRFIAAFASLLFGIHPLHVESIAWAAERKDVLYTIFFFLSLIYYVRYIQQEQQKLKPYLLAFLFFVLSIFSKAMAASLPPLLLLIDFYYKRKINVRLIAEKVPYFLLALIMGIVSVNASSKSGSIAGNESYAFIDRVFFACHNLLEYLFKLFAPVNLSAYYPYPEKTGGSLPVEYYLAPVLSIGILLAFIYSLRSGRFIFFCFGFFVITIFLVLQLLPVGPAIFSERYSYVPSAGFFLMVAFLLNRWLNDQRKSMKNMRVLFVIVAGAWCLWLCAVTWSRCKVWKDSITLWDNVIGQFDKALHAYNNRADAYYKNGNYELAVRDLDVAISLNDKYAMAWFNRGNAYGQLGKFKEAYADLDKAISLDPANANAYNKRGQAHAVLGNKTAAFEDFNHAISLDPSNPEFYYNIGITWINAGNKAEACQALEKAVQMGFSPALKAYGEICK